MNIYVKKSKFGICYKMDPGRFWQWHYFPPSITTKKQMQQYFMNGSHGGGRLVSPPTIILVAANLEDERLIKHFKVQRGDGRVIIDEDLGNNKFIFSEAEEAYKFLKGFSSDADIEKAQRLSSLDASLAYLKEQASEETLSDCEKHVKDKLSDAGLTKFLDDYSSKFKLAAEVEFQK